MNEEYKIPRARRILGIVEAKNPGNFTGQTRLDDDGSEHGEYDLGGGRSEWRPYKAPPEEVLITRSVSTWVTVPGGHEMGDDEMYAYCGELDYDTLPSESSDPEIYRSGGQRKI